MTTICFAFLKYVSYWKSFLLILILVYSKTVEPFVPIFNENPLPRILLGREVNYLFKVSIFLTTLTLLPFDGVT